MENEQMADQMLAMLTELLQVAGPEWTMEFLQGGLEAAQEGGGEMQQPEVMSQGGPGAMPAQGRTVGKPRMM